MSTSNVRKLILGQRVTIMTRGGQKLSCILVDKCDWSVGCPVVEANGIKYGIGYQAEVVSISESVDIEKQSRI